MRYFPVNLDLQGKSVVVIGGGEVAGRKVETLLEAGARVRVVAPQVGRRIAGLGRKGKLLWRRRGYRRGDLRGAFLGIAATEDPGVHQRIRREANRNGVLLNIVDEPGACDFVFPSRINRGEFMITISTGGASPALSQKIRRELEKKFGREYGSLVNLLGKIREGIPTGKRGGYRWAFHRFIRSQILEALRKRDAKKVQGLVRRFFGNDPVTKGLA